MQAVAEVFQSMPRAYRHFAVITLCVTALMALFADGENRAAMAGELHSIRQRNELKQANSEKFGKKELLRGVRKGRSIHDTHFDYSDADAGYGQPMDSVGARVQDTGYGARIPQPRYVPGAYARYQISEAELAKLTPEEREKLLKKLRGEDVDLSPEERERQRETMIAASLRRSGSDEAE